LGDITKQHYKVDTIKLFMHGKYFDVSSAGYISTDCQQFSLFMKTDENTVD